MQPNDRVPLGSIHSTKKIKYDYTILNIKLVHILSKLRQTNAKLATQQKTSTEESHGQKSESSKSWKAVQSGTMGYLVIKMAQSFLFLRVP